LWVNITLKKNYGFLAPLFYSLKSLTNYKRFWYINSNSWSYFSYLFKRSLIKDKQLSMACIDDFYNNIFHSHLSPEFKLIELSEIAVHMAMFYSKRNEWLIEESNWELDHSVSTYDSWRESVMIFFIIKDVIFWI
jgi:hypothetical protein